MEKTNVLLVDDDTKILKQFSLVLNKSYETTAAISGNEALNKIQGKSFSVIVSDYNMNNGDGLYLLDKLNNSNSKTPVILVSGHANSDIAIKFANLHVFKILEKPVSPVELEKAVKEASDYYARVKLEEKQKFLGKNTGQIIHDINNNLFIISATAEIGMESTPSELIKKQFSRTLKSCNKIIDMVKKYKNFLTDEKHVSLEQVEINSFVKSFCDEVSDGFSGMDIKFQLNDKNQNVSIDPILFHQVLLNVLNNCKEAMSNSRKPEVKIEVQLMTDRVCVVIKDNGPGIPEDNLSKIFAEGFSTKSKHGTGMGLKYCKHIMDLHLGDIVAVASNSGACFKIEIPKQKEG